MEDQLIIIRKTELAYDEKEALVQLWNTEYPVKLALDDVEDLEKYLQGLSHLNHFLLAGKDGKIRAWAYTFDRQDERWFAIILSEVTQGKGHGRRLIHAMKETEDQLNGWVMDHNKDLKKDGRPYRSPLEFYKKNGFTIHPEIRLESEEMSALKIVWQKAVWYKQILSFVNFKI